MSLIKFLRPGWAILLFLFEFASGQDFTEKSYPVNYFRNPLGIPIQLAGNFGELRSNHFHMGLDMRTNQKENLPVYAAAEGYVSRIIIEKNGYGRAIVIAHPNGYSTLYAHLNDFYRELNDYVKAVQYKEEKWEQDIDLKEGLFKISKGQFIAWSGNTGGSQGPHLHFEIRETQTNNNINPLHFDFHISDRVPPLIYGLYLFNRNNSTYNSSPVPLRLKRTGGHFETTDSVIVAKSSRLSFGISTEDKTDNSFKFGVYQVELWIDDTLVNGFRLDNFSYDYSRYVNACIDYKTRQTSGRYIQHLTPLPGNKIPIYLNPGNDILRITDDVAHKVEIKVKDVKGNTAVIKLKIRSDTTNNPAHYISDRAMLMKPNEDNGLNTDDIKVEFDRDAFYDTVSFAYTMQEPVIPNAVSKLYHLHNFTVPVQDSFTVRIKAANIQDQLKDKVIMQLISNRKKVAVKGTWKEDWLEAKFWDLGTVQLVVDTIPAVLRAVGFKTGANLKSAGAITFFAKDDAGAIKNFRAELDGKWLMFSRKDDYFTYRFDEQTTTGLHNLEVLLQDEAGNTTRESYSFLR